MKSLTRALLLVVGVLAGLSAWAVELTDAKVDQWLASLAVIQPFDTQIDEQTLAEANVQTMDDYVALLQELDMYQDLETALLKAGWQTPEEFFAYSEAIGDGINAVIMEQMIADFPPEFRDLLGEDEFAHVAEDVRVVIRANMDKIFESMENQRYYEPE